MPELPGGAVDKNLPCQYRGHGFDPGLERFCVSQSTEAHAPEPLNPCPRAHEPQLLSLCGATTAARVPKLCSAAREVTAMRSPSTARQSRLHSPHGEEAPRSWNQEPGQPKINKLKKKECAAFGDFLVVSG